MTIKPTEIVSSLDSSQKNVVYFPGLDALRFFSFFGVFCAHALSTNNNQISNQAYFITLKDWAGLHGVLGVSFFFVLSGFLISYLLMAEVQLTGGIHLRAFYTRRILRIWPLYFLTVFIGYILYPLFFAAYSLPFHETASPLLCATFLNNFSRIYNGYPAAAVLTVLWSVAIEEQFYLIWPILFKFTPHLKKIFIFFTVIIISLIFRALHSRNYVVLNFHTLSVISDMAMGGLGAYVAFNKNWVFKMIKSFPKPVNLIPYILIPVILFCNNKIFITGYTIILQRVIMSFLYIWIILEQVFSNSYFKFSKLKTISKWGGYTYGLYCLHLIPIFFVTQFINTNLHLQDTLLTIVLKFILSLVLSIGLAKLSFLFFEKKFLRLKEKFAFIHRS